MHRQVSSRRGLTYWPVPRRVLIALVAAFVVALAVIELGAVAFVYGRLGLSQYWAYAALAASFLGSRVNIPIATVPTESIEHNAVVVVFGIPYVVPTLVRQGETVIAVNVGGAVVPCLLAGYLLLHAFGWEMVVAIVLVTIVVDLVARPVAGVGVVVPTLVPPLAAVMAAELLGGAAPAAVAFVSGTLGALVGADLLHLKRVVQVGAPVVSIGGAGTFDGIFLTGIIAVLLAA